jgi:hypothetical protein
MVSGFLGFVPMAHCGVPFVGFARANSPDGVQSRTEALDALKVLN